MVTISFSCSRGLYYYVVRLIQFHFQYTGWIAQGFAMLPIHVEHDYNNIIKCVCLFVCLIVCLFVCSWPPLAIQITRPVSDAGRIVSVEVVRILCSNKKQYRPQQVNPNVSLWKEYPDSTNKFVLSLRVFALLTVHQEGYETIGKVVMRT